MDDSPPEGACVFQHMHRLTPLVFITLCISCQKSSQVSLDAHAQVSSEPSVESLAPQADVQAVEGTFVGSNLQHPNLALGSGNLVQMYFLPSMSKGKPPWIALVPMHVAEQLQSDQLLLVRGTVTKISLGGPAGTKGSYANKVIRVQEVVSP